MAKLGKHIYPQEFDIDNQIDFNYAIFPDSFTFGGPTGGTGAGTSSFYTDYSSIANWSDVRDVVTVSCTFVIDQIDTLYQTAGGLTALPGLSTEEKEALSKNFLIPKSDRDLIHTEAEQREFSTEIYSCSQETHKSNSITNAVDFIVTSDNSEAQTYLNNSFNFITTGGGGGSVSSVNGQVGSVILGINELDDVNTSGLSNGHVLTYNGVNWVTELRPPLTIHTLSQNYLNYNSTTGELFMENLSITDVTVENSATSASIYFSNPSNAAAHQEGDTIIFTNTLFDTEVYMHNGGTSITFSDYTRIKSGAASEAFTRSLFSGVSPISYDSLTGIISISQSGTQSNGFLSQTDYNLFNNKVDSVNGEFGAVILSTSNITEGVNLYYTDTRARLSITGGTGINYNPVTGEIVSTSGGAVDSVNGQTGVVVLTLDDLGGIDNTGVTAGYILTYDGFTWSGATAVNSINGQTGFITLSTDDISEGSLNLYYTDTRARQSVTASTGILYDNSTGFISANINDSATNSTTELWSANQIYNEIQIAAGATSGGAITSVNGKVGIVSLSTVDISENTNLYYTDTRVRNAIGVSASSGNYLNYDSNTGLFNLTSLAITNVTTDSSATSSSAYFSANYTGTEFQEGDTVVMTAIINGTETYIHNGGTAGTSADFIQIQAPNVTDGYIRSLLSSTSPIAYETLTGVFSMNQANNLSDGYLRNLDWITFNNKVDSVNGKTASVILKTNDISDSGQTNLYFTNTLARGAVSGNGPIIYDTLTGTFSITQANVSNSGYLDNLDWITFNSKVDTVNGITGASVSLSIDDLTDVDTTTATASVDDLLKWNGTNWTPTTFITKKTWTWGASRDSNSVTDSYLRQFDGTHTNQSAYVAFFDCKIKNMSVGTNGSQTWIAETRINGIASATMSISALSASYSTFDVSVSAGDKISFYCNGSSINRPNIQILLEEI